MVSTKQNWFPTLNEALESEGLLDTWDAATMGGIHYGQTVSYHARVNTGQCMSISIYRDEEGRYERPVYYRSKFCENEGW